MAWAILVPDLRINLKYSVVSMAGDNLCERKQFFRRKEKR